LCLCLRYPAVVLYCVLLSVAGLALTVISTTIVDLLQGLQQFQAYTRANFIAGLVLTGMSVIAIWRGSGPVGLSVSYLTGPATSVLLLLILVHRRYFPVAIRWNPPRYKELL